MKKSLRPHFWQTLANFWEQGFGIVFSIVLARILAPEQFGEFVLAMATMQLLLIPFGFSIDQVLVSKGTEEGLYYKVMSFTYSLVGLRLLAVAGLVLLLFVTDRHTAAWICAICGIPESAAPVLNVMKSDLEGAGTFSQNFLTKFISAVLSFVAVVGTAILGWGVFSLSLPCWIGTICSLSVYRRYSGKTFLIRPRFTHVRELAGMGVGLWVNNAAEAAMQRMDKWFVGSTGGAEVLGLYNRAFTFSPVSHFAFNSLLTNPAISEMARRSSEDRKRYLLKTFLITSGGGIVTMVFWLLLADPLVVWIFGAPWKGAIPYFKAMSALALCYAVLYVPVTFLFSLRHYTIAGIVRLAGVVALLCFLLMSQGHVSALGVSYVLQATLLAMGLVMWGAVAILSGRRYRPEGMNASEKSTECHG